MMIKLSAERRARSASELTYRCVGSRKFLRPSEFLNSHSTVLKSEIARTPPFLPRFAGIKSESRSEWRGAETRIKAAPPLRESCFLAAFAAWCARCPLVFRPTFVYCRCFLPQTPPLTVPFRQLLSSTVFTTGHVLVLVGVVVLRDAVGACPP